MKKVLTMLFMCSFLASTFWAQAAVDKSNGIDQYKKVVDQIKLNGSKLTPPTQETLTLSKDRIKTLPSDREMKLKRFADHLKHSKGNSTTTSGHCDLCTGDLLYFEDFDAADPGWFVTDGQMVGEDGSVDTTTFAAYREDGGHFSWLIGTVNDPANVPGDYPGYDNDWAVGLGSDREYTLQNLVDAELTFKIKYNIEGNYDFLHFQVSTDAGMSWTFVPEYWTGGSNNMFVDATVDLSNFIGENIMFRWVFYSDGSYSNGGGGLGFSNEAPGAAFFDQVYLWRDGNSELIDDGGDVKKTLVKQFPIETNQEWSRTTNEDYVSDFSSYKVGREEEGLNLYSHLVTDVYDLDALSNKTEPLMFNANLKFKNWVPWTADNACDDFLIRIVDAATDNVLNGFYPVDEGFEVGSWNSLCELPLGLLDLTPYEDMSIYFIFTFYGRLGAWSDANAPFEVDGGPVVYLDDLEIWQLVDPYEEHGLVTDNDDFDNAYPIDYGFVSQCASIYPSTDLDFYSFSGSRADLVDIWVSNIDGGHPFGNTSWDGKPRGLDVTGMLWFYHDYEEAWIPLFDFDMNTPAGYDRAIFVLPYDGDYMVTLEAANGTDVGLYEFYLNRLSTEPAISSIKDVTGDQGGEVSLTFDAAENDLAATAPDGFDFDYWDANLDNYVVEMNDAFSVLAPNWTPVVTFEATGQAEYGARAFTRGDGVNTAFRVGAKMNQETGWLPAFSGTWWSDYETGVSQDNILPEFVDYYTTAPQSGVGVDIFAQVNLGKVDVGFEYADLVIYRGETAGFTPGSALYSTQISNINSAVRFNDSQYDGSKTYYYVIECTDDGGNTIMSKEISTVTGVEDEAVPTVYSLTQNYPNPFNPATTIKFGIPQAADVTVKIFDVLGQEVTTLVNQNLAAGFHTVNFDASNLISGLYIYRIQASGIDGSNFTDIKKMLLVK